MWDTLEAHFSHPSRVLSCELHDWAGAGEDWEGTRLDSWRASKGHRFSCVTDSIKKLAHELLGAPCQQIPPTGLWVPPVFCVLHSPPTPGLLCWLPVHAPTGGSKSELWQMASEHVQKIDLNLRTRENLQT